MAKVNIKSEKITPFGGIYHASKAFYALSLDKVTNGTLGVRSSTYNGYQWDEIMSAMSDVFLCGGSYSEDIIRTIDGNCRIFYIRAIHSASIYSRILDIREWRHADGAYQSKDNRELAAGKENGFDFVANGIQGKPSRFNLDL